MVEESLLTDELRAHIGKTAARDRARVTPHALQRASETYFERAWSPVPTDGDLVPGFVIAALETESAGVEFPSVMPNSLLISNEWQFERQIRMGEEFDVQSRLADISERVGGRYGYSLYFRSEVEFREPGTDTVVAKTVQTLMVFDASSASDGEESE